MGGSPDPSFDPLFRLNPFTVWEQTSRISFVGWPTIW